MNFDTCNHQQALITCQTLFDRPPYNQIGDGLPYVAQQIQRGDCRVYELRLAKTAIIEGEQLSGLIERIARRQVKGGMWSGLGKTLAEKLAARRNIDYYRLNFIERIALMIPDCTLGDENGADINEQMEALFPELSFAQTEDSVVVTFHLPNRH